MKKCPKCKSTKGLTKFHNSRVSKDGKATICAECTPSGVKRASIPFNPILSGRGSENFALC